MLERLTDLPQGIDGLKAIGKVSKDDYVRVVEPLLDEARREGRRIRFLYQFGITASAAILVSLLVSFTLTPMMSARLLGGHVAHVARRKRTPENLARES